MQLNSIYLYPNKVDAYSIDSANWTQERYRMVYNRNLKLYRGSDNRIDFQVRNGEQKAISLAGSAVVFTLTNLENEDRVIQKDCVADDITIGRLYVTLTESEMLDIEKGFYKFSITKETRTFINETDYTVDTRFPLYLDSQYGAISKIEVIGNVDGETFDTIEITEFEQVINFDKKQNTPSSLPFDLPRPNYARHTPISGYEEYYYSSIINGQPNVSTPQTLHTFQFLYNNYKGEVVLQGSIGEGAKPIDDSWEDLQTYTITASDQNAFHNITGKYNWFRIKHTPDENNTGTVDKVLYR